MARRKKAENETQDETKRRHLFETVADLATRSEKVSWDRKMDNMVSLIAKLKPIEDQILDLMTTKTPILDEISALRKDMVRDCVHPYEMLVHQTGNTVRCKFCDKQLAVKEQK